jgi:putative hydrolase of the HAD superfamily
VADAFARADLEAPDAGTFHRAHYTAAAAFTVDFAGSLHWQDHMVGYLDAYMRECGVPDAARAELEAHLRVAFSENGLWTEVVEGAADGLAALQATGVALGVVSNAGGAVAQELRDSGLLQVGPGPGVEVLTILDSGAVGVAKPDPRIFAMALLALRVDPGSTWYVGDTPAIDVAGARRAGIHPVLVDPYGLHADADYPTVRTLVEVAELIEARPA